MGSLAHLNERLAGYWESIDQGFLVGVLLGAALPLLLYLVLGLLLRRRRCRGLRIAGEGGTLFVSIAAVREFVRRLVHEFPDASFHALELTQRGDGYRFDVAIDVPPTADMMALRHDIGDRLRREAGARLGLADKIPEVNVVIHRILANEQKWHRQKGDATVETTVEPQEEQADRN
jgi:hypothetical protein